MLLLLIVVTELLVAGLILKWVSFYAWFLTVLIYGIAYWALDDGPVSGHRSWNKLRSLGVWARILPVKMHYMDTAFGKSREPLLFVAVETKTPLPLIYAFGLLSPVAQCSYLLPGILFRVPLLRDALLCLGAVADSPHALRHMILSRRSVACAFCEKAPPSHLFELARELGVKLVPVLTLNETKRYAKVPPVPWVTEYCTTRWNWPFPVCTLPRFWGRRRPPQLQICIGTPMNAAVFEDNESFENFFATQVETMKNVLV